MRNVSRNKFLHCFRPMVDMDVVLDSESVIDRSADLGFAYITMEDPKALKVSSTKSVFVPGGGCSKNSQNSTTLPRRKRTFSRVIKAVFFESILARRARDREGYRQGSSRSSSSGSFSGCNDERSLNLSPSTSSVQEIKTSFDLSNSSSTSSNSVPESQISSSDSVKQKQRNRRRQDLQCCSGLNYAIYLLLISFAMTVLWGRLFAIVFTSVWLYFAPCWCESTRRTKTESERKCLLAKRESRDYKKGVIMEGLLQRNHNREGIKVLT